jgi:hypothetical protein
MLHVPGRFCLTEAAARGTGTKCPLLVTGVALVQASSDGGLLLGLSTHTLIDEDAGVRPVVIQRFHYVETVRVCSWVERPSACALTVRGV